MKKKSRLSYHERQYLNQVRADADSLRFNYPRRLRNAVLSLAQSDPHWIIFIEQNIPNPIPPKKYRAILQMIESRARVIILRQYNYFHREKISEMIFQPNWHLTDTGTLGPG